MKMALPLILFTAMSLTFIVKDLLARKFPRLYTTIALSRRVFTLFSFLIITLYTFSVSSVFTPFACVPQSDGSRTLAKYPGMKCFDNLWMERVPYIVVFICIYCIIIPVFLVLLFYRNRHDLDGFTARFQNLVAPYKRDYFYWELVFMVRKAVFVLLNDFLTSTSGYLARFFVGIGLLCVFLWCDAFIRPYRNDELNFLQAR
jgi:hypothetical protein